MRIYCLLQTHRPMWFARMKTAPTTEPMQRKRESPKKTITYYSTWRNTEESTRNCIRRERGRIGREKQRRIS